MAAITRPKAPKGLRKKSEYRIGKDEGPPIEHERLEEDLSTGYDEAPPPFLEHGDPAAPKENSPFKDLTRLLDEDGIRSKSILSEKERILMHKLLCVKDQIGSDRAAAVFNTFSQTLLVLKISQGGASRSQFIEALKNGRQEALEHERLRVDRLFMGMGGGRVA